MPTQTAKRVRPDYQLSDSLWAERGTVFMTGTQALLRLMVMQRQRDAAQGWNTAGFISGYRGSPLGMVDQAIWKAGTRFEDLGLRFVPAVNEELAATQVLGTQRVESDPERTVDAVFGMWYGKGPGVDRAGDAIKHGNAYGSSPKGGVLVVAGDDHGCVSSSMPHQSDPAFMAWSMPVLQPACVAEYLEFGLYGYALSRYSGAWVGMAALSEVVESGATVDLDAVNARTANWVDAQVVRERTGHQAPADGLHYRWPDLPSLDIERRLTDKLTAVAAFAKVNSVDREVIVSPRAQVGLITCGKAHFDLMEVLRRLQISPQMLSQAGVRLYKVGLAYPLESSRLQAFMQGLREVLVIEEKSPVVETQLRDLFYNAPVGQRPVIVGKRDAQGAPFISPLGELRPSRLIEGVARWLAHHFPGNTDLGNYLQHVRDFTTPELLSNAASAVKRVPYFCAGCPHNTSTRVPKGSTARAGIGCHFMANWMERDTAGLIQMGGEGVDWVSHAQFTRVPHVFQNLGDGTYYHSGYLAIRQAVAAKATLTYKILFNEAVAMTGGQPIDGQLSVEAIAHQVQSEGVKKVVVVSDDITKYNSQRRRFPAGTEFYARDELDRVQRELRTLRGVTVLIYEQICAAKKRRIKKLEKMDSPKHLFINDAVCEGCADCTVQSNCVAVLPHETAWGRKRKIDQTACNKDDSCLKGFCPSFVRVSGGTLRRKTGVLGTNPTAFLALVDQLQPPRTHTWSGPYDLLVTGVGGTGVVTVGAIVAVAAHLEGKCASVLDFMGFAQKGGSVLSFVRLAQRPEQLNQVRIDTQQADAILACDMVVGASDEALQTVRFGRTQILVNVHEIPVAESLKNPDAQLHVPQLLEKLHFAAGVEQVSTFDAQTLAEEFLGDTVTANILALGFAWQRGLIPLSLCALERAIELNGVAVEANKMALSLGRLAADGEHVLNRLRGQTMLPKPSLKHEPLEALLTRAKAHLSAWQNEAWAMRFERNVLALAQAERKVLPEGDDTLAQTAALSLLKLMSYKDEYEVARLYTNGQFARALAEQFEGQLRLEFFMAPPLISGRTWGISRFFKFPWGANSDKAQTPGAASWRETETVPRKLRLGPWLLPVLKLLAKAKWLRGSVWDVFGKTEERRMERRLIVEFEQRLVALAQDLNAQNHALAVQVAALPQSIRGYGHVKLANVALARARETELLHRFNPQRYARPESPAQAGQIKGIAVVAVK